MFLDQTCVRQEDLRFRATEEITVKFTSGEFAEVACIVARFALVMCQPNVVSLVAKECCVSAEFANSRFMFL